MKFRILFTCLSLFLLLLAPLALAHDDEACNLVTLFEGWARATVEGAPTSAAYGLLANLGDESDILVSASTPAAEVVELHEMVMGSGDVMQMRPVEGGFVVGPHSFLELRPGGLHIMLINLTGELKAGEMLELTLQFEKAGEVALTLPIREIDAMAGGMMPGDATPEARMDGMAGDMKPGAMMHEPASWPEGCAGVHILDPWARPAGPGMPNSAAYGLLVNLTAEDVRLVSASTPAAQVVELHEMVMGSGDVMQMRPIEGGIVVPAGGVTLLKPGGLHVMLINLTGELKTGSALDLTLTFEGMEDMPLTVPVREPEESGAMMPMGGG